MRLHRLNMADIDCGLVFATDNDPTKGFTNTDANRDHTKDEIVIRELLQNALDSGTGSRSVRFVIQDVPAGDIFGLDDYRRAFDQARSYLADNEPTTGKQMIKRIDKALGKALRRETLRCLFCCDNGAGIGEDDLRSLYGSGRSTKHSTGRGSVGHGHLTAFVPSDLRYVLYAGRRAVSAGAAVETFGGHAIVATHITGNGSGREQRSADGYIRQRRSDEQIVLFDNERGGTKIPPVLARHMNAGAGAAVMIAAYEPVSPNTKPGPMILASAARHFLVAVFDEALDVTFTDPPDATHELNPHTLHQHIEAITPERSRRAARRTLRTLQHLAGRVPDDQTTAALGPGARVWLRPQLQPDETATHRVSVFRDGMWIQDNTTNYLQPRLFGGVEPFDAVVDLDSDPVAGMGRLVRTAEGASHLRISPSELDNPAELVERFAALRSLLTDKARPSSAEEPYTPPQLRLTGTTVASSAMPKRRPKRPDSDDTTNDDIEQEIPVHSNERDRPNPPETQQPTGADKEKTDQTVKAGNSTGLSTACRPDPLDSRLFHVAWNASSGNGFHAGSADLCLAVPSGTDQTSRHRIAPEYLTIASVKHRNRRIPVPAGGAKQVRIPEPAANDSAQVRVTAAAAAAIGPDSALVQAVLYHRNKTPPSAKHSR